MSWRPLELAAGVAVAVLIAGCSPSEDKSKALQLAAKVNGSAVSASQISDITGRAGKLSADQTKQMSKQVLERLIDQELLVQQALGKRLDVDPKVVQAIEAARREILARAYVDQVAGVAPSPTAADISEFFAKHPELFAERRIYRVNELRLPYNAQTAADLRAQLNQPRTMNEIATWLRDKGIQFAAASDTRAAEQVPLGLLPQLHRLKDGEIAVMESQNALLVVQVVASQAQPMDEKAATPFIEQQLIGRKRAELAEAELKQLRDKAKIEYFGEYATAADAPATAAKAAEGQPSGAAASSTPGAPGVPALNAK